MTDTVTAFLGALAQTEWLPEERLVRYQRELLDRLVRHARAETDFYADRLAQIFRPDDSIDWDRWGELPILTRADAQGNFDALKARHTAPVVGRAIENTTSGSTGRALRTLTCDIQMTASACASERFLRWHGIDPGRLTAVIHATDDPRAAPPDGAMKTGSRLLHPESRTATLTMIRTPVADQIAWLQRIKPAYLVTYPTLAREIAREARASGIALPLEAVMTIGEALGADTIETVRGYFGRAPLDRYSATETGLVAATCPHSGKHHVMSELILVEILDERGAPVPAGTPGRAVLTPLYGHAMPFIRYAIGDYAILSAEPCGCGRGLPTLDAVLGRETAMFRFADGKRIQPDVRSHEMQPFVPHRQYQLVQIAHDRVEMRYVPADPGQANDIAGLTDYLRRVLHPSIVATATPVGVIERLPGGKYLDAVGLADD